MLAAAYDPIKAVPTAASVRGRADDAATALLAGWLSARLGVPVPVLPDSGAGRWMTPGGVGVSSLSIDVAADARLRAERVAERQARLPRNDPPDSMASA